MSLPRDWKHLRRQYGRGKSPTWPPRARPGARPEILDSVQHIASITLGIVRTAAIIAAGMVVQCILQLIVLFAILQILARMDPVEVEIAEGAKEGVKEGMKEALEEQAEP